MISSPEGHRPGAQKITILLLPFRGGTAKVAPSVVKTIREFFRLISLDAPARELDFIEIRSHVMPIRYRKHARARNYVLRLHVNKTVVVTVPRQGTKKFARQFVASRKAWLEKQWAILEARKAPPQDLRPGMQILLHGNLVLLEVRPHGEGWELRAGTERTAVAGPEVNLRPVLERHLRHLAKSFLVKRVEHLAGTHGSKVRRVVIRNQKSRWGSCSCQGTISLNWRLIQLPEAVRDYIIIHELMHLRQLNHSPQFWAEVGKACPGYRSAEEWLKQNSGQVGF
jgi:predicted metal-dependent hydrolase